jgi:hypothetical protein
MSFIGGGRIHMRNAAGTLIDRGEYMRKSMTAVLLLASMTAIASAQDWYHDREARFRGEQWRPQVFSEVRTDLDHIWSARGASEKENARLDRTK